MKKFDTVLFDFDGTIMNTNEVILRSWQHTFQTIEHRDEDVAKIIKTFGEPLEVTMKKFFPDVPVDEAVEIYRSYHRDNFGDLITVFPGMKNLLRQVKERGEKTGLVTSRLAYTTKQGLEKYDLKDYFDVVVTAEDTKKHKPLNIAFFPLDPRLGEHEFDGIDFFVKNTNAEYVFPMHMWQDYSKIKDFKRRLTNRQAAERVIEIERENQSFAFEENY